MTNTPARRLIVLAALLAGVSLVRADSKNDLFGDLDTPAPAKKAAVAPSSGGSGLRGYVQFELAHSLDDPQHWSKLRTRGELSGQGRLGGGIKWKASARLDYDTVFDVEDNFYPDIVRHDQRATFELRETYLDVNAGNWDFRLGRQHVVWGEMVGLFFADVVSARDLREFILPDFESLRTPQWAVRAEYFNDDFHGEVLWVPLATYDKIGKPGAEFYPYQPVLPGSVSLYDNEDKPARKLANGNLGVRASTLKSGWDLSAFVYRSMDIQPTFYRRVVALAPTPIFAFTPRHERITQIGGTLAKDFEGIVLKAEAVHTRGRKFAAPNPLVPDGLVAQDTLDWATGLDFTPTGDSRINVQLFQRVFFDHDPGIIPEKRENGYSLFLSNKFSGKWEGQATFISSMNRTDWLFRPRVQWNFEKNWRLLAGVDIFKGPPLGMFGQYDNRDRVYSEVRYSF
jgi:hypothetical protein